jgi:hypothetical protein
MSMLAISVCPMFSCGNITFFMGSVAIKFWGNGLSFRIGRESIQPKILNVYIGQYVMISAGKC